MQRKQDCPCGGGDYATCCGRFHAGALPDTAEQLMRSRYSAYVRGDADYLRATWDPAGCPADLAFDTAEARATKWLGLEIRRHLPEGDHATVEFVARFRVGGGRAVRLHETSRFARGDGRWRYLDGRIHDP